MHLRCVDHHKYDTDHGSKQQIHRQRQQFLDIGAGLLQLAQRLTAALVFKEDIREFERMADSVRVNTSTYLLRNDIYVIILKILGDAGDKGHADRHAEQQRNAANELTDGVSVESRRILVDHVPEDQGIEQRENLIDCRQNQRGYDQLPVTAEVAVECAHYSTLRYGVMAQTEVPCGSCTECCRSGQGLFLHPEQGDDIGSYRTEARGGRLLLATDESGACVYLGANGCTIYERRPLLCRSFDCRKHYLILPRQDRDNLVRLGLSTRAVFNAARARIRTLDAEERRDCLEKRAEFFS